MYADVPPPIVACPAPEALEGGASIALSQARQARLEGDFEHALCVVEAVLVLEPLSADAWVESGLAHSASGHNERAREAFLRALQIAPDYDDARIGLARLAYRAGNADEARAWLSGVSQARLNDSEITPLRRSLMARHADDGSWRIDAFAAYSSLSADLTPWREASWSVMRRDGDRSFGAALEVAERFGISDVYGEVRIYRSVGAATWGLALGGASDAHFRPEAAIRAELSVPVNERWVLSGALNVARYSVGEIDRLGLRAERTVGESLRLSGQGIVVRDETDALRTGYALGAAWQAPRGVEFSLAWSDAPESAEGVTIDVRSIGVGAAADISPGLRVRAGILREERDAFDRIEFSLAVARTF